MQYIHQAILPLINQLFDDRQHFSGIDGTQRMDMIIHHTVAVIIRADELCHVCHQLFCNERHISSTDKHILFLCMG